VNGSPISLFTVRELLKRMSGSPHGGAEKKIPDATLIQEALNRAVFEELAYQKGVAEGLAPSAAEIDAKVKGLKDRMGGEEAFSKALQDQGLTEAQWTHFYERSLVTDRILRKKLANVVITDEQLQQEYEKDKAGFYRKEKVAIADIVFFLKMDDPASIALAEKVLARLRNGEDKDPSHLVPDGTFIVHDIEVDKTKQPELYAEARKLQVGQFSGVIRASDALHVIQLKEYVAEKQFSLEDARGLLTSKLQGDARRKMMQDLEVELKKEATIKVTDMNQWKDKL
ncbi:MAG TPA: peptidyl-prolyl cis-trans isomerase, partial [Acidobacteriota bacterium]|nr:peptidyl-prolyl cis-trans isomerase [Acidobacteriota bacterium]